jgi:F0F1-type ATP synthase assembly protein I
MADDNPGSRDPESNRNIELTLAIRTFCRGVLHAIGMFDPAVMTEEEKAEDPAEYRTWFCLGETGMAALLALNIAVPAFFWFAGITALPLAFIGAAVIFLPVFVFLPKLIRYAMKADTDAVLEAFGKNEQVKKVFWSVFIVLAGLVLAEVADPATAQAILAAITGA